MKTEITTILIYQGYPPFDDLLPKVLGDISRQTIDTYLMISEQSPVGLIEKGILYDKLIDKITTDYILFSDVDVMLPLNFLEYMLEKIKSNDFDIVYATLKKRVDYRKTCDGIFMLKKDVWLDFRKYEHFPTFLGAKGIPTYLTMFMHWCGENKRVGYLHECPIGLRLQGNTARGHQRHPGTKNGSTVWARKLKEQDKIISHWNFINNEWQKSPPAKDNRV